MLVNKKTDDHKPMSKFFHSSAKLIVNVSKDDKSFGSMHKSGMTKVKKNVRKDWVVETIVEHGIKIFER